MSEQIAVIGGGVSGVTTALMLQLLDFETEIYAEKTADQISNKNDHPEFASLYPSASVIPHSVYSDKLKELFQFSQSFFYELRKQTFPGLTIHKHFEVFEFDPGRPDYCKWMLNFQSIEDLESGAIPRRANAQPSYGWSFDCIFADWTMYFPALRELYQRNGGSITQQKLQTEDITNLPAEIVINCSGTGSPNLFDDPVDDQLLMRGHLLHKSQAPLITSADGEIISYNYTPEKSVYADASGKACDVYCYPRQDGWVLGGSRQACQLSAKDWGEDKIKSPKKEIDGFSFPRPIIDLNNEILKTTYGLSIDDSDDLSASIGYRYIRSRNNGLRLDHETINGQKIFHNYGHGGAGVTLSWGCALEIARKITSQNKSELQRQLLEAIND